MTVEVLEPEPATRDESEARLRAAPWLRLASLDEAPADNVAEVEAAWADESNDGPDVS